MVGVGAAVAATPEKTAFVEHDLTTTFVDFDTRAGLIAGGLAARGVGNGDRVAIMLPNSVAFFEVWLAAAKLNASVVLVNTHLKDDEVAYIVTDSEAKVLVDDVDLVDTLIAEGAEHAGEPQVELAPVATLAPPVFYTSGTTGRPKGVVHGTFDDERATMAQQGQVALWGWLPEDVYLLSGPAYHAGPGGYVMSALFVGATTVILPRWDAREWLRLVDAHRVTLSFMTPAHFIRILEVPAEERAQYDLVQLAVDRARRRAVPGRGEAEDHRRVARDRDLGAVRRERGRRDAHRSGRVAGAAGQRRPAVARRGGPHRR